MRPWRCIQCGASVPLPDPRHYSPLPLCARALLTTCTMRSVGAVLCASLGLLLVSTLAVALTINSDPTPIQQRIALQPGGMTVSWSTVGPIHVTPTIAYGTDLSQLNQTQRGWTRHYHPSVTFFHHVVIHQLQPSTTYYWQVTSPADVNSSVLSFTTAPKVGENKPFTVSINGDMGLGNEDNSQQLLRRWTDRIDLFWHVGDLSYADDYQALNTTYEAAQEAWMDRMDGVWSERPYMFCPGNHETSCNEGTPDVCTDGQQNFTSYRERFRMPARESGAVNNMWFSFDYGLVHFISVDTEVDYPGSPEGPGTLLNSGPFGDQLAWLEADLKKAVANRATVPWILAAGHRPYYSSNLEYQGMWPPSQQWFEPLFVKYGVDIVYWGHIHWYERSWPTALNGTVQQTDYVDATAPVYIVSAAPGNVEGLAPGQHTDTPAHSLTSERTRVDGRRRCPRSHVDSSLSSRLTRLITSVSPLSCHLLCSCCYVGRLCQATSLSRTLPL